MSDFPTSPRLEQKPDVRFPLIGAAMKPVLSPRRVSGKLPAWFWREFAAVTRQAGDRIPALVIEDGDRPLIVVDADDYNKLVDAVPANGPEVTP